MNADAEKKERKKIISVPLKKWVVLIYYLKSVIESHLSSQHFLIGIIPFEDVFVRIFKNSSIIKSCDKNRFWFMFVICMNACFSSLFIARFYGD